MITDKGNYGDRIKAASKTSMKEKSLQNEKRNSVLNEPSNKQFTTRLDQNGPEKSAHAPASEQSADKKLPTNNRIADIITSVLQSWKTLSELKHENTNKIPSQFSVFNDLNRDDISIKSSDDETADENQRYKALTENLKHFVAVPSQYDDEYNIVSETVPLKNDSEDAIPSLLQTSHSEKDEGDTKLSSVSKIITIRTRENVDLIQSRILKSLYNF